MNDDMQQERTQSGDPLKFSILVPDTVSRETVDAELGKIINEATRNFLERKVATIEDGVKQILEREEYKGWRLDTTAEDTE